MRRIDTHVHFWAFQPNKDTWITDDMAAIRRDFMPKDLKPQLEVHDIVGCIAVQAEQSEDETAFLLELADRNSFIKGVVGWVDLQAANVDERLEYFRRFTKLKGFRHIVQDESDPQFLLRPAFLYGVSLIERYGYSYDILVRPHQLAACHKFISHFPKQRFIINHSAKPNIAKGGREPWASDIEAIAQYKNVYCKLSGLITEADVTRWKLSDFEFYLNHIIQVFGGDRLLFGSDWPVCLLGGRYRDAVDIVDRISGRALTSSEAEQLWHNNASIVYRL